MLCRFHLICDPLNHEQSFRSALHLPDNTGMDPELCNIKNILLEIDVFFMGLVILLR